jgi:hypothetical protein
MTVATRTKAKAKPASKAPAATLAPALATLTLSSKNYSACPSPR